VLVKIEARILIFPGTDFHFPSTSVPPGTFLGSGYCSYIYLRCGGVFNNQIKKGLLLSQSVSFFHIGEYLVKLQARTWLSRTLFSSFSVVAKRFLI